MQIIKVEEKDCQNFIFLCNVIYVISKLSRQGNIFIQRVPALREFWDLEKTVLHEICVSRTVVNPLLTQKSPHLHVHKTKTVVVETVSVILV